MENQKKPDLSDILIIVLFFVLISLAGYLGNQIIKNNLISLPQISLSSKKTNTLNTDSIYLSTPIRILYSAQITAINPKFITVNVTPVDPPTENSKNFSFKVNLTDTTEITEPKVYIPYVFKIINNTSNPSTSLSIDNLSVGESVDITLTSDLRTTQSNNLTAKSISKIDSSNMLTGKITSAENGVIRVNGTVRSVNFNPSPNIAAISSTEKSYSINYSDDTEIITNDQSGVHKITSADLVPGTFVTVYADKHIVSDSLTAALISAYSLPTE